jgi:serine/threonine-protein kinase
MNDSSFSTGTKKIICPLCGEKYDEHTKFCGVDGTNLTNVKAINTDSTGFSKVCSVCNNKYPSYAEYCATDAKKLTNINDIKTTPKPEPENKNAELDSQVNLEGEGFIGQTVAQKYRIDRFLGEGGMAQVYRATHLGIEKIVVIKIMFGNLPSMKNSLKRFEQECKLTAKLNHPNVVSVFDSGTLGGKRPYLVMEYIDGESLRDKMFREDKLSTKIALEILIQMCSGLSEAHSHGIVHRDLKPENIMLRKQADRPDWVKIVDFGIAYLKQGGLKLTATGVAVGTVDYMSPEYLSDKPVDHRADIYALGIILFELITGKCPFEAENAEAVMAKHLFSNAHPISNLCKDIKPGSLVDQIIEKALQKEPNNRYQTTQAMKADLDKALKEIV